MEEHPISMALGLKTVTNSPCCFCVMIFPFDFQRIDLLPFPLETYFIILQFAVIALETSLVWVELSPLIWHACFFDVD